ncbi:MAG: hypothetical protein ABI325_11230 [Ginsengibacter sp.]
MKTKTFTLFCLLILSAITGHTQDIQGHTVQQRVKISIDKIAEPLKLDASQLNRIDSAFTEFYEAQNKMFADSKVRGSRADYTVFEKILNQRDARLKVILTPGQYSKFKTEVEESLRPQFQSHEAN